MNELTIDAAVMAWPGLEANTLRDRVAQAIGSRELSADGLRDLTLAMACAMGHGPALEAFDVLLREEVARVVRPLDASLVDEVTQVVRARLLMPENGTLRLEGFRAEAPLRAWVRAVALRLGINAQRAGGRGREVPVSAAPEFEADVADPELALLRARYRQTFRAAFTQALASLSARERTVLRLYSLDGLTLARIAALYQKDTSTVSRWLDQTRQTLLQNTRAFLAADLDLEPPALESLMRAADTEMSVSLSALLRD